MYGKQIIKNGEAYMTVEKMVVDFVLKNARFRVKDQGHQQLSEFDLNKNESIKLIALSPFQTKSSINS